MNVHEDFQNLASSIQNGDKDTGVKEARSLYEGGYSIADIFEKGVVPCMEEIGEKFSNLDLFLPDMMIAADVVKGIHSEMEEELNNAGTEIKKLGKVVIGTAYGDIHELGKNIVASMLEVSGFEVVDMGVNVSAKEFVDKIKETKADILAISSLLTPSIPYMKDTIELINGMDGLDCRIMVGGGPVSPEIADKIGAHAYGEDASAAVSTAKELMGI